MDDRLKIGFVSLEDHTDVRAWSGTPYHMLEALKKQNISIEIFNPLKQNFRYPLLPLRIAARLCRRDIEFNRYQIALRSYAKQLKQKMQKHPVDVVFSLSSIPITLLDCPEPIIFYTDAMFHRISKYYGGVWDRLTSSALRRGRQQEEAALQRCTFAVYSSTWVAEGSRELTQPDKVRVVPFGANMAVDHDLETVRGWVEERVNRISSECRLLFIGVDWARKGGDVAVEATRLINEAGINTRLTIVGCQPADEVPAFVDVIGFVSKQSAEGRAQLKELYKNAHFFILPTRAELSAIVYCEASAHGLPIVTFKTGGAEDYVREGINGFCLPSDSKPEGFATYIRDIMKDKNRYSALCLGGFNEYKSRLNWDTTASALVNLCREAMQGQKNQSSG